MYIYIYNGVFYTVIKNNEIMLFAATWMDLEIIILNKVKSDRERQILYNITYMWNLEDRIIYKTKRESQTWKRNVVIRRDGGGSRVN